jgi:hypothetical protein
MKKLFILFALLLLVSVSADAQGRRKSFTPVQGKYAIIDDSLRTAKLTANGIFDYIYADTNAFTTTGKLDTVVISGLLYSDKVFGGFRSMTAPVDSSNIVFFPGANGDTLFVTRTSGILSGAKYQYMIIR